MNADEMRAAFLQRVSEELDIPVELLQVDAGPGWWGVWMDQDRAATRQALDEAVATIAPDVLRGVGLDPEHYTLSLSPEDWRPGPYRPEAG